MRFKKNDWTISKEELIKELENYYIEFQVSLHGGWSESQIRHFLHVNFHIMNNTRFPNYHYVQQIIQMFKEEVNEPQPLNTKDTQYPQRN